MMPLLLNVLLLNLISVDFDVYGNWTNHETEVIKVEPYIQHMFIQLIIGCCSLLRGLVTIRYVWDDGGEDYMPLGK